MVRQYGDTGVLPVAHHLCGVEEHLQPSRPMLDTVLLEVLRVAEDSDE